MVRRYVTITISNAFHDSDMAPLQRVAGGTAGQRPKQKVQVRKCLESQKRVTQHRGCYRTIVKLVRVSHSAMAPRSESGHAGSEKFHSASGRYRAIEFWSGSFHSAMAPLCHVAMMGLVHRVNKVKTGQKSNAVPSVLLRYRNFG